MVFIYSLIDYLAGIFDKEHNQVRIIICFFLSFLLSYGITFIKKPSYRYWYSFLTGFGLNLFMYEWQVVHPILMMLITYFLMRVLNRDKQHLVIFFVLYTYQSGLHLERMMNHYGEWGGEVTSFTMNLVCRLISLGFCYRDGGDKKNTEKLNSKSISHMPTFWQMLGYTYNPPSCVASPFFEYKDYEEWIELKGSYSNIPDTFWPGTKRLLTGVLWLSFASVLTILYKPELLLSEEFCNKSFLQQSFQQYMSTMAIKYTYFSVFAFNDGS